MRFIIDRQYYRDVYIVNNNYGFLSKECTEIDTMDGNFSTNTNHRFSRNHEKKIMKRFIENHQFTYRSFFFLLLSLLSFIADLISDSYLVYIYYRKGEKFYAYLTLFFLIFPSIVVTLFSAAWYSIDKKTQIEPDRSLKVWITRLVFHFLQIAPLIRLIDSAYYGFKSLAKDITIEEKYRYLKLMLYEEVDTAMLRLIECFLESLPQLLLQLYILFSQPHTINSATYIAQVISCVFSLFSITWCLTSYQTSFRQTKDASRKVASKGYILYFCWKFFVLSSRILSLILFTSCFSFQISFAFLVFHWLITFNILMLFGTNFCNKLSSAWNERLFDLVLGLIFIFDILNVRNGHSRIWFLFWYTIHFLQNISIGLLWLFQPVVTWTMSIDNSVELFTLKLFRDNQPAIINKFPRLIILMVILTTFLVGIFFMNMYYLFGHPSGKIKWCLSISEYSRRISQDRKASTMTSYTINPVDLSKTKNNNMKYEPVSYDDNFIRYNDLKYIDEITLQ